MPLAAQTVSVERLLKQIAAGKHVPAAVLLLGSEDYLRDACRAALISAYTETALRAWAVARFSARDDSMAEVLAQAQMQPMLVPRQVIFYGHVELLERLGDEERESALARLKNYLEDPAPFTILVLEAKQLDQRMRLFKLLTEKVLVAACEIPGEPEEREAMAALMAEGMAQEAGVALDGTAARLLAEAANGDLVRMRTELEKLATYVGPADRGQRITAAEVKALVVSEKRYTVWQLSEMLASGDAARALRFLETLLDEGEQPVAIVGALAWMYRKLCEAQELPRGSAAGDAARILGMRRDTAEIALRESRRMPRAKLREGLVALAEADSRLKSGVAAPRAVMEFLVTRLASRA